jgi:hypothetical protein
VKNVWIICAVMVALAAGFALPGLAEEQQSVAGEWKGEYTGTDQGRLECYLTLKQDGEKVTGEYFNPGAGSPKRTINRAISGTFKNGVFAWGNFKGTVTGDTMTGRSPLRWVLT